MSRELRGFSLIEAIVGVALMLLLFLSLFGVLRASLMLSAIAKSKAVAIELASTQMEYLHGLAYDAVGTVGGIPAGLVPQTSTSTVDGVPYVTRTYIEYHDDPADGIGVADASGVTTDYKTVKVSVSYSIHGLAKSVSLVSNLVPPGVESTTGGGTLSIHIVNKDNADVSGASVQIVNASTSPAINFTTFSNVSGFAIIGGAATSSEYQVFVSREGYSSAQTYARTGQNVNPTPGYFTVSKDQTTPSTFQIDVLSALALLSFSPAVTTTFTDSFTDGTNLATQTNTQAGGGALTLTGEALSGSARSVAIVPDRLTGWGVLSGTLSQPAGSTVVVRVDDTNGVPLPDAVLPGNSAGFSSFPVFLTGLATSSYPGLTLEADITREATTTVPSILTWSLSYTEGLSPVPNISFTLTGAKTIGTNASDQPIYKTIVNDTTGASATKTESLEWDSYTLVLGSANLIESCPAPPYAQAPGQTSSAALIVGTPTTNTLPLLIEDAASIPIPDAKVVLTADSYAATVPTSSCGIAYFNGLAAGTYTATVSATGYATAVFPNIAVAGHTATTPLILP